MNRRLLAVLGSVLFGVLVTLNFLTDMAKNNGFMGSKLLSAESETSSSFSSSHRKLLHRGSSVAQPERIRGESCTKSDIVINQGPTAPLPSGIPTYTVEIMNICATGCAVSGIHLTCGWFSSVRLLNPKVFRRLRYNDCLVNNGKPLVYGGTLSFQYANTFLYPLAVSSVACPR